MQPSRKQLLSSVQISSACQRLLCLKSCLQQLLQRKCLLLRLHILQACIARSCGLCLQHCSSSLLVVQQPACSDSCSDLLLRVLLLLLLLLLRGSHRRD